MKKWVDNWKQTGLILEALRNEDIRNTNTVRAMEILSDAIEDAISQNINIKTECGLIEYYKILLPKTK